MKQSDLDLWEHVIKDLPNISVCTSAVICLKLSVVIL